MKIKTPLDVFTRLNNDQIAQRTSAEQLLNIIDAILEDGTCNGSFTKGDVQFLWKYANYNLLNDRNFLFKFESCGFDSAYKIKNQSDYLLQQPKTYCVKILKIELRCSSIDQNDLSVICEIYKARGWLDAYFDIYGDTNHTLFLVSNS